MAFINTLGIGTPISPRFSIIDVISLIIKHTITQSRIKLFPLIKSVKLAIITTTKYTAFRIIPLNPALLSSLPVSDFGLYGIFQLK